MRLFLRSYMLRSTRTVNYSLVLSYYRQFGTVGLVSFGSYILYSTMYVTFFTTLRSAVLVEALAHPLKSKSTIYGKVNFN